MQSNNELPLIKKQKTTLESQVELLESKVKFYQDSINDVNHS
jgi:hypothetical protein